MNIFVLDRDPVLAAKYQCDKHVVKMILESAQMLCLAFPQGTTPYKNKAFKNHPCSVWARKSRDNFEWLLTHAFALCDEFELRYKKTHKSKDVLIWCQKNSDSISFESVGLTDFAIAMPDECVLQDPVEAYRLYYKTHKKAFAKWPKGKTPHWWSC